MAVRREAVSLKNQADLMRSSPAFQEAKEKLIASIRKASDSIQFDPSKTPSPGSEARSQYQSMVQEFGKNRGRELYYPFIGSGLGNGCLVELVDGSVKYDLITGIGIHFFGHTHPGFLEEMVDGLASDVMQGNLEPGIEMHDLLKTLLGQVGRGCRLNHGWIVCSGTMANEIALKTIRQHKAPATKILAFKDCFAGRSTAMQEITDNPNYRQGQPVYGEVHYLPFYQPKMGLDASVDATIHSMQEVLKRFPGKVAALMIELVQGEGGFLVAPREYYVRIFEEAKKAGLAIWVDEIQSFGRTGELFAYQKFSLNEFVDVVTLGKLLQSCAVLYTDEYNPKPGLVAGTFSGSTTALRTGRRVVELLTQGGYLGADGKIEKLSKYFVQKLTALSTGSCRGKLGEIRAIGGMIAAEPLDGSMEAVKAVLMRLYDLGVIAFYCGHGPYLVRFLPPFGVMGEKDIDQVCKLFEQALLETAESIRTKN